MLHVSLLGEQSITDDGAGIRARSSRALALIGSRMKLLPFVDLLAKVGGSVQDHPATAVGADRNRGLGAFADFGVVGARPSRGCVVGVPLGKSAAGG